VYVLGVGAGKANLLKKRRPKDDVTARRCDELIGVHRKRTLAALTVRYCDDSRHLCTVYVTTLAFYGTLGCFGS
jgi:hypothetical protein